LYPSLGRRIQKPPPLKLEEALWVRAEQAIYEHLVGGTW
jgi:hypothetical protein